jgi:pimeloyl-ACP methyl ester carboxylesterase
VPRLPLDGTDLYFEVEGTGPDLLLVHGLGLDGRMWDDQVDGLAGVARLLRPDLRGFGRSERDPGVPYSHVEDLVALLDAQGIDQVDLVGQSMGGMIALEVVHDAPHRVRSLVLVDTVIDGVPFDDETAQVFRDLRAAIDAGGVPAARRVWFDSAFFAPARRDPVIADRIAAMVDTYAGLDWLGDDPHRPRPALFAWVGTITVPVTVVVGELDVPSFREMAERIAARVPGARLVVVPGVGHMANMEAPAVVNDILSDVLGAAPR